MRHGLRSLAIAAGAIAGASGGLVSRPHAFSASAPAAISRRASSVHASVAISKPPLPEVVERAPATHPAFELVRVEMVDEYTIKVATYRHRQSGAEVISAQADDENKVFGIAFRTPVEDSTGVPHILEHSVLCGSAKYTSKEPFTELLKGSLQTFLNAFTYPDRTCYPVASCNTKDFYNLVNVYLDAVLSPRAKRDPTVFAQEGWHYELDAAEEPLTYKGVVFNEMKGVYSSPDQLHYRALKKALFRGHPIYAIDSGGDPRSIPTLTYDAFADFHRRYYHPSNAKIYVYGDEAELPTAERLALLESWLAEFGSSRGGGDEQIPWQPAEPEPYEVSEPYPVDAAAAAAPTQFVTLGWLFPPSPLEPSKKLAWGVLNDLLLGKPSAALQQPLLASKLGSAVVGGGYGASLQQAAFSVGLKGVAPGDEAKGRVSALILETLDSIAESGFEQSAVEASMNTIEFRLRAASASPMKGLSFMMGALSEWVYGRDPIEPLRFEEALASLKEDVARRGGAVFVELLRESVLENRHRCTLSLVPEPQLGGWLQAAEEQELSAVRERLSAGELKALEEETRALRAAQAARDDPADLAKLPTLSTSDLTASTKSIPIEVDEVAVAGGGRATLLTHELPTDGLVYLNVGFDLARLPIDDVPYVPLLCRMMSELGTDTLDETAFSRTVSAQTGSLGVSTMTSAKPRPGGAAGSPDEAVAMLMLSGRAVADKAPQLFDLAADMLASTQLDNAERAVAMLKQSLARAEAAVVSSGNSYASAALAARFSLCGSVDEMLGGVSQLHTLRGALEQAQSDWPALLARLERMRSALLSADGAVVNLSADEQSLATTAAHVPRLLGRLPSAAAPSNGGWAWSAGGVLVPSHEGLQVPTQVSYVAKALPIFQPGERICGSTSVVSRYLRTAYLWNTVRVQGGAYGCNLAFSRLDGRATFSSYRDPNLAATLEAYDGTGAYLRSNPLGPSELSKAIIGAVGELDAPQSVDARGVTSMVRHLLGVTEEERQIWRDEVLATTAADFVAFADRIDEVAARGSVAVVASESAIAEANVALPEAARLQAKAVL
mmetsp:Transcript_45662/g.140731  ORF Transcript_45662/g.140731 Transcript_45662/m.140731 type:complete len:1065 (+) Transcript_45662:44-3238(+)